MATMPEKVAAKIQEKIEAATMSLEREMKIMRWPAQYQTIVWEALIHRCAALAKNAKDPS